MNRNMFRAFLLALVLVVASAAVYAGTRRPAKPAKPTPACCQPPVCPPACDEPPPNGNSGGSPNARIR
jgi:hypothetical protein